MIHRDTSSPDANDHRYEVTCDSCRDRCPESVTHGRDHWAKARAVERAEKAMWKQHGLFLCPACRALPADQAQARAKWWAVAAGHRVPVTAAQFAAMTEFLMSAAGVDQAQANRLASAPNPAQVGTLDTLVAFLTPEAP